jgi:DNA polymerase III subunit gamma/tau
MDLRQFNRELVEYLRALLLAKTNAGDAIDSTVDDIAEVKALAKKTTLEKIVKATKLFGQLGQRFDNYSTLPLELALVDSAMKEEDRIPAQPAEETGKASGVIDTASMKTVAKPKVEPVNFPPATATKPKEESQSVPPVTPVKPVVNNVSQSQPPPVKVTNPIQVKPPAANTVSSLAGTPMEVTSEIERLKVNWKMIIKQAPADTQKTPAVAILRSAPVRPISIENNVVCLAFSSKIFKEKIETLENQRVTERVISSFLGRPCQVKCILEENHLVKEALKIGAQITNVVEEK